MPPPWATNPAPKTESAKAAAQSFFCTLCQKGYSRITEFEAHESSYDHQHKKRLKEMKQMSRDPGAAAKARRAEEKADAGGMGMNIKPISLTTSGGAGTRTSSADGTVPGGGGGAFKKGGFKKNAFGGVAGAAAPAQAPGDATAVPVAHESKDIARDDADDMDLGNGGVEVRTDPPHKHDGWIKHGDYDPREPTECHPGCPGRSH